MAGSMKCNDCEAVMINGVLCHEHGCPSWWKFHPRNCVECNKEFQPEFANQICCSDECWQTCNDIDVETYPETV